jgi:hypothetical protein
VVPPSAPGAEEIVQIWERGRREHTVDRALTILHVVSRRPRAELAALSLECRDTLLLSWRATLFGEGLVGYAACPRCGCGVDVVVAPGALEETDDATFVVEVAGAARPARLPNSLDLVAVAACQTVVEARRLLAARCLEGPDPAGEELDDDVIAAVEAELDRRAGVSGGAVSLTCSDCGQAWQLELDVGGFIWREIEALATRLLLDVDVLARRYGWSEGEILNLSPARRSFYLELAS